MSLKKHTLVKSYQWSTHFGKHIITEIEMSGWNCFPFYVMKDKQLHK